MTLTFVVGLAGGYLAGGDTGYLGYLPVQSPDTGLAGVLVDDLLNRALEEAYLALLQAVGLKLLGYQVALGDADFLLGQVSGLGIR